MNKYFFSFKNIRVSFGLAFFAVALSCLTQVSAAQAGRSRSDLVERIQYVHEKFAERMYYMESAIPVQLLADAKAIIFVRHFKAGAILGLKGGYAISMLHDDKGNWSPPCFHKVGGGSIGLQVGGHQVDAIYLLMTRDATRMLTGDSGDMGLDASAVAGPLGKYKDISTFTKAPVLVYADYTGLYAGATAQGGVMTPSKLSNANFYDDRDITALDILEGRVSMPKEAKGLANDLRRYTLEGLK